jgi:hypothetical protein
MGVGRQHDAPAALPPVFIEQEALCSPWQVWKGDGKRQFRRFGVKLWTVEPEARVATPTALSLPPMRSWRRSRKSGFD